MKFYLGTHIPSWLWNTDNQVRFFVSRNTLKNVKTFKRSNFIWSLDSGGFTELHKHGKWTIDHNEYSDFVLRCVEEIGLLDFVAPQDWMCERTSLQATGKSVFEHQLLTINNFCKLRESLGNLVIPVLQGDTIDSYIKHIGYYKSGGIDLTKERLVGLGSICRRQHTQEIVSILKTMNFLGISIHGFGVKKQGLLNAGQYLTTADSLAWSFSARYSDPLPGCTHANCANCIKYALKWRNELI